MRPQAALPVLIAASLVMAISAQSSALRGGGQRLVADIDVGRRLEARSDALLAPLDFERAGDDAANGPDLLPFLAERIVAPLGRDFREALQVNGAVLHVAMPRKPRLLGRKAEQRREPRRQAFEQRVQHRKRRAALQARIGLAIERVLADIEVDGRKIVRAELREQRGRPS